MQNIRALLAMSILPVALAGCATADKVQALEQKVESLEKKVGELEARPVASGGVDQKLETAAQEVYKELTQLVQEGELEKAAAKGKVLKGKYASTATYKRAGKLLSELEVVGKTIGTDWAGNVEKWYQGEGKIDLSTGTTMVVFWEVWCPHCRNHMPEMVKTYDDWNSKGLNVVGITRITKSATEEKVVEFIKENKLNYPLAKENGNLAREFGVGGIPAAAVVKDGKIVWRGHPARLSDDVIGKLL